MPKITHLHLSNNLFRVNTCGQITHNRAVSEVASLDELSDQLLSDDNSYALVGYPNPVITVAEFLQIGKSLPEALLLLTEAAEPLMKFCRRHRRQVSLFDLHAAGNRPDTFERVLDARFPNSDKTEGAVISLAKTQTVANIQHLIIRESLSQSSLTAPFLQELGAISLNLGPAYEVNPTALMASGLENPDNKVVTDLREDKELLMQQLHQVQEELESYCSVIQEGAKLQQEAIVLQRDLKKTTADLAAVRASFSWRITAPARWAMSIFMGKSGIND